MWLFDECFYHCILVIREPFGEIFETEQRDKIAEAENAKTQNWSKHQQYEKLEATALSIFYIECTLLQLHDLFLKTNGCIFTLTATAMIHILWICIDYYLENFEDYNLYPMDKKLQISNSVIESEWYSWISHLSLL